LSIEDNDKIEDGNPPAYRKRNAANIFAVDRRAWAKVCDIGLNAAVAYLLLARGTGGDQRTVGWSVNAIENKTGIGRLNAKKAIEILKQRGLIRQLKSGTKPQYYIVPAQEVLESKAAPQPLTSEEQRILRILRQIGNEATWVPKVGRVDNIWEYGNPYKIACGLANKGYLKSQGGQVFSQVEPIAPQANSEEPDWIWLPNSLIDGVDGETAPVERVRQTQDVNILRLFIDLYHDHELLTFGGINWRPNKGIKNTYIRHKVADYREYTVWGFEPSNLNANSSALFVKPHLTGESDENGRDTGWNPFFERFGTLTSLGLVQIIPHLVESETDEGEIIFSQSYDGEEGERDLAFATYLAAEAMLQEWQLKRLEDENHWVLIPALKHMTKVQLVGVARLRYRPQTETTALWLKERSAQWTEWTKRYDEIRGAITGISRAHATSR
jgi:hypothetical protein